MAAARPGGCETGPGLGKGPAGGAGLRPAGQASHVTLCPRSARRALFLSHTMALLGKRPSWVTVRVPVPKPQMQGLERDAHLQTQPAAPCPWPPNVQAPPLHPCPRVETARLPVNGGFPAGSSAIPEHLMQVGLKAWWPGWLGLSSSGPCSLPGHPGAAHPLPITPGSLHTLRSPPMGNGEPQQVLEQVRSVA